MSYTPEEKEAMEKDIRAGVRAIILHLQQLHQHLPIAISRLNPHATGTRKLLEAASDLYEVGKAFEAALKWDFKIKDKE